MAVNKVEYGNDTLIDLTEDTVDEESVLEGRRFHAPDGSIKEGKVVVAEVIDNLESENSTDALSARQGKVLNEKIDERSQGFSYDEAESKLTFSGAIGGSGMHVYSDEEHVVGVWKVDGVEKPVYERTFKTQTQDTNALQSIVFNTDGDIVVDYSIILKASDGWCLSQNNWGNSSFYNYIINANRMLLQRFTSDANWKKVTVQLTIQYTKTTD